MGTTESTRQPGDKLKKALKWISEITRECPDKKREEILKAAEIRFDLSPTECEFLDSNFG
jgi:hypothetical protein